MKDNLIIGLDIGSSTIKIVVGQVNPADAELYLVAASEVPSAGVSKGMLIGLEDAVSAITSGLEQAERIVGQPLKRAYVGISGTHITAMNSKGVVAVSRADNEVTENDVARVIEAAQAVATPPNSEILHVIPRVFNVDNQVGIKDPVGMTGVRLEVETKIIHGSSSPIKNLTKAVYRTGLQIDDLVLSILANAEACLTARQKELGVVLVNIGNSTTSLAVFEEGDILTMHVLPLGSAHVTSDIAIGLRTSLEVAEEVKLTYGQALGSDLSKKEEINLGEFDERENERVSLHYVVDIIEARMQEIFDMVDKKLIEIERSGLLPAGVVLTGGGAKLPGLVDLAKREFRLPASLGLPRAINTAIDKVNDLSYTTAIGLVLWGYQMEGQKHQGFRWPHFGSVGEMASRVKDWVKSLIP